MKNLQCIFIIVLSCCGKALSVKCSLGDDCITPGGETRLTCSELVLGGGAITKALAGWTGPTTGTIIAPSENLGDGNKYHVVYNTDNFTLIISDTEAADFGNYTCKYGFGSGAGVDSNVYTLDEDKSEGLQFISHEVQPGVITVKFNYNGSDAQPKLEATNVNTTIKYVENCLQTPGDTVSCSVMGLEAGMYSYAILHQGNCDLKHTSTSYVTVIAVPVDVVVFVLAWYFILLIVVGVLIVLAIVILVILYCIGIIGWGTHKRNIEYKQEDIVLEVNADKYNKCVYWYHKETLIAQDDMVVEDKDAERFRVVKSKESYQLILLKRADDAHLGDYKCVVEKKFRGKHKTLFQVGLAGTQSCSAGGTEMRNHGANNQMEMK